MHVSLHTPLDRTKPPLPSLLLFLFFFLWAGWQRLTSCVIMSLRRVNRCSSEWEGSAPLCGLDGKMKLDLDDMMERLIPPLFFNRSAVTIKWHNEGNNTLWNGVLPGFPPPPRKSPWLLWGVQPLLFRKFLDLSLPGQLFEQIQFMYIQDVTSADRLPSLRKSG